MKTFDVEMPIDCLVCTSSTLIAGGYLFSGSSRSGKIYVYSQASMEIEKEFVTSGTLDIKINHTNLYMANSKDVSAVSLDDGKINKTETADLNTYISIENNNLFVSDIGGNVRIYNEDLETIGSIKVADDPIWVSEAYCGELISGCEAGSLSFIDVRAGKKHNVMKREAGITSIHRSGSHLYVGSYDEHVEMIDVRNHGLIKRVKIGGGVWRILSRDSRLYMSCMYEGLKICNTDLEVLEEHRTESIAYGIAITENKLFFSSFYDRKIHILTTSL